MNTRITRTCNQCGEQEESKITSNKGVAETSLFAPFTCDVCRVGEKLKRASACQDAINAFDENISVYKEKLEEDAKQREQANGTLEAFDLFELYKQKEALKREQTALLKSIVSLYKAKDISREWWNKYRKKAGAQWHYIEDVYRELHVSYIRKQYEQEIDIYE